MLNLVTVCFSYNYRQFTNCTFVLYVSLIDGRPFSEIYARQLISKISREELEDKYLRLQEDNQVHLMKLLFVYFVKGLQKSFDWIFLNRI